MFKSSVSSSVNFQMADLMNSFMTLWDKKGPVKESSHLHVNHVTQEKLKIKETFLWFEKTLKILKTLLILQTIILPCHSRME